MNGGSWEAWAAHFSFVEKIAVQQLEPNGENLCKRKMSRNPLVR